MSVTISDEYLGAFQTKLTHGPSKQTIQTDAPVDNGGKGSQFSPTDMLAASYASCMMTIMGLRAEKKNVSLDGLKIDVTKHMTSSAPRKISTLDFNITLPKDLTEEQRDWLVAEAKQCPVALSVHPSIELNFKIM